MTSRAIMIGAAALLAASTPAAAADLPIALAGPMSGANALFGPQLQRGAELAVKDINAAGGVLGRKLVLRVADDACDSGKAVAVARDFVASGVAFVDGHFCSGASIAASAIYAEAGILQITPASNAPALTDDATARGWINVFRAIGRDEHQGIVSGTYLAAHFTGRKVAILDDGSGYGRGIAGQVRATMNGLGLIEAMTGSVGEDGQDLPALVATLQQAGTAAVFFGGSAQPAARLVRTMRAQGLSAQLVSDSTLILPGFWEAAGTAGEGTLFTFYPDWAKRPSAQRVAAELRRDNAPLDGFTFRAYAAIQLYAQAATQARSTRLADVAKALHAGSFDTVLGPISFDAKGDIIPIDSVLWRWTTGSIQELPDEAGR
jgi:branched-chain amino acid transport system substrate-binding protein